MNMRTNHITSETQAKKVYQALQENQASGVYQSPEETHQ